MYRTRNIVLGHETSVELHKKIEEPMAMGTGGTHDTWEH